VPAFVCPVHIVLALGFEPAEALNLAACCSFLFHLGHQSHHYKQGLYVREHKEHLSRQLAEDYSTEALPPPV